MTLRVRNWERWQSYRRDRGQPPWIKVHRQLMRNIDWVSLTDAQRGQLVAIWLLAADHDGVIPASPSVIQKLCFMDSEPDLQVFAEHGFIEGLRQPDAVAASDRRQPDAPEAEAEAEAEAESLSSLRSERSPNSADAEDSGLRLREGFKEAFKVWSSILPKGGRNPKPNNARRTKYEARRREGYDQETILAALTNWIHDPWEGRMQGIGTYDMAVLLRSGATVEKFAAMQPGMADSRRRKIPDNEFWKRKKAEYEERKR